MKRLVLLFTVMALIPLAGCAYRPYPHGYYGDRYYGGYYGRDYRDRYRDSDRRDYWDRDGYYDRDNYR